MSNRSKKNKQKNKQLVENSIVSQDLVQDNLASAGQVDAFAAPIGAEFHAPGHVETPVAKEEAKESIGKSDETNESFASDLEINQSGEGKKPVALDQENVAFLAEEMPVLEEEPEFVELSEPKVVVEEEAATSNEAEELASNSNVSEAESSDSEEDETASADKDSTQASVPKTPATAVDQVLEIVAHTRTRTSLREKLVVNGLCIIVAGLVALQWFPAALPFLGLALAAIACGLVYDYFRTPLPAIPSSTGQKGMPSADINSNPLVELNGAVPSFEHAVEAGVNLVNVTALDEVIAPTEGTAPAVGK